MISPDVNPSPSSGADKATSSAANGPVVNLVGGFETLLWTLLARATDAVSLQPILDDYHALKTVSRVKDTGFKFHSSALGTIWGFLTRVVSVRSKSIDMIAEDFLKAHPKNAIILHLASALDSRSLRVRWQGEGKLWIDVDQEDVVKLRKQFIDPVDAGAGEYRLTGPKEYSQGWLTDMKIPGDRPVLIIMEGLSMYLSEAENLTNFKQFIQHFQDGGEIVFDVLGSFPVWAVNSLLPLFGRMTYNHGWHLNEPKVLEEKMQGALKVQQYIPWAEYPATDMMPFLMRWCFKAFAFTPFSGYVTAILRCSF